MRLERLGCLLAPILSACPVDPGQAPPVADTDTTDHGDDGPSDYELGCDGLDDDQDGRVDEGCGCAPGATQACYGGDGALAGVGACALGSQVCLPGFEFGEWSACEGWAAPAGEVCGDGVDGDCDGAEESCAEPEEEEVLVIAIDVTGDCITASCPATYPYPVACDLEFHGGDPRGCVASSPGESVVYLQEGNDCDAGRVTGTLTCSTEPGPPLDATSCPIAKEDPTYATDPADCAAADRE